jgi:uncharacterized membrane protein
MADEQQPASPASEEPTNEVRRASAPARTAFSTEVIISWILRVGVSASALLIALGVVLLFVTRETGYAGSLNDAASLVQYTGNRASLFPTAPGDVLAGLVQFKPYAFIALGLLLLIATPVIRVAASVVIFLLERDYAYVLITLFVLVVLVISFLLGKAG